MQKNLKKKFFMEKWNEYPKIEHQKDPSKTETEWRERKIFDENVEGIFVIFLFNILPKNINCPKIKREIKTKRETKWHNKPWSKWIWK